MVTVRHWGVGHGSVVARVAVQGTSQVRPTSTVYASACEWNGPGDFGFIGAARFTVCSVVPGAGYVDVWLQIDWGGDLEYRISLLIPGD